MVGFWSGDSVMSGFFHRLIAINGVASWREVASPLVQSGTSIACSDTGSVIIGCAANDYLNVSSNSGITWSTKTSQGLRNWRGVAVSKDGQKMYAVSAASNIFRSTDSGSNWLTSGGSQDRSDVCCSYDGSIVYTNKSQGDCEKSIDSGATFNIVGTIGLGTPANTRTNTKLCCSSDGSIVYAAGGLGGAAAMKKSIDSGVTWSSLTTLDDTQVVDTSCSSDGQTVYMLGSYVHVSTDAGVTWSKLTSAGTGFFSICCSTDGSIIKGHTYSVVKTSSDYGVTWTTDAGTVYQLNRICGSSDLKFCAGIPINSYFHLYL